MRATTETEIAAATEQGRHIVLLIAPTIFLRAFLLFCSEPMVGKMMLPLLGGAAAVWITCLLFFQLMLLAGYLYAHVLERYANVRAQMLAHACLMMLAIVFLPMRFATGPDAAASSHPTLWLLGQLIKSVGIPFGVVSTTAPLLQNWLSKTRTTSGRDPYFLYAVSNAGSLLALLAYPFLIEPRLGVRLQSESWFAAYAVFAHCAGDLACTVSVCCGEQIGFGGSAVVRPGVPSFPVIWRSLTLPHGSRLTAARYAPPHGVLFLGGIGRGARRHFHGGGCAVHV